MPRFFVEASAIQGDTALLTGKTAQHMAVLRLRPGEPVTLCTGDGRDYACTLAELNAGQAMLRVDAAEANRTEPGTRVMVFVAYAKADKLEHVIQKATELGAAAVVAYPCQRCVSRPDDKSLARKLERWQAIALAAAEQSGRGRVPRVTAAQSYAEALALAAEAELGLFFYENETAVHLHTLLAEDAPGTISILTGPEGGFTPQEVELARAAGLHSCSLGPRILRCETAPLCALSAVMFARREL